MSRSHHEDPRLTRAYTRTAPAAADIRSFSHLTESYTYIMEAFTQRTLEPLFHEQEHTVASCSLPVANDATAGGGGRRDGAFWRFFPEKEGAPQQLRSLSQILSAFEQTLSQVKAVKQELQINLHHWQVQQTAADRRTIITTTGTCSDSNATAITFFQQLVPPAAAATTVTTRNSGGGLPPPPPPPPGVVPLALNVYTTLLHLAAVMLDMDTFADVLSSAERFVLSWGLWQPYHPEVADGGVRIAPLGKKEREAVDTILSALLLYKAFTKDLIGLERLQQQQRLAADVNAAPAVRTETTAMAIAMTTSAAEDEPASEGASRAADAIQSTPNSVPALPFASSTRMRQLLDAIVTEDFVLLSTLLRMCATEKGEASQGEQRAKLEASVTPAEAATLLCRFLLEKTSRIHFTASYTMGNAFRPFPPFYDTGRQLDTTCYHQLPRALGHLKLVGAAAARERKMISSAPAPSSSFSSASSSSFDLCFYFIGYALWQDRFGAVDEAAAPASACLSTADDDDDHNDNDDRDDASISNKEPSSGVQMSAPTMMNDFYTCVQILLLIKTGSPWPLPEGLLRSITF